MTTSNFTDPRTQFIGDCDIDAWMLTHECIMWAMDALGKAGLGNNDIHRKVVNPILQPVINQGEYIYMFAVELVDSRIIWFSVNRPGFAHNHKVVIGQFLTTPDSKESGIWVEQAGSNLDNALKAKITYEPKNTRPIPCKCGASTPCGSSKKG